MGWLKKGVKKLSKNLDKTFGKASRVWMPNRWLEQGCKATVEGWNHIRTPLAYAGAAVAAYLTGGLAAGALGTGGALGGATAAGAASAAVTGAVAGTAANEQRIAVEKAADRAAAEQERIAAEEAEQNRRLSLLKAGQTPEGVSELSLEAKRRMRSQYQRNQVSRQNNKKLGGASSTLA